MMREKYYDQYNDAFMTVSANETERPGGQEDVEFVFMLNSEIFYMSSVAAVRMALSIIRETS